jgi:nucleoside-diphosphate-sugar epimerase
MGYVIHLAGKAHEVDKNKVSALNGFRLINTDLTLNLAKQAVDSGVNRFVFRIFNLV